MDATSASTTRCSGLIIPYLTFALPLSIYILVSFFREIPKDLEEAALVDGATNFEAFRKVVVPLAAPGLATDGDPDVHRGVERVPARHHADVVRRPRAPCRSRSRSSPDRRSSRSRSARSPRRPSSISIPLIILVLLFQKRIVAGLTAGAVKG